jgi:hypothetical protein
VTLPNGEKHPIHWLEDTITNFYRDFIEDGKHFYETQLIVRFVPEGTSTRDVRAAFAQWKPARINSMAKGKYFYIVFSSVLDCATAFEFAQSEGFSLKGLHQKRPLMGETAFANERPLFVKDVTVASCACQRCLGMDLLFKGLMIFRVWNEVCPRVAELIEDVKAQSGAFSPSLQSLIDTLLCAVTGFHRKSCSYGNCTDCG